MVCYCFSGITRATEREDDDVPALRSRTEWETAAALKTYAAAGIGIVVTAAAGFGRLWRRPATRRARRHGGLYPQLFRAGALCKKAAPRMRRVGRRCGCAGGGGPALERHLSDRSSAAPKRSSLIAWPPRIPAAPVPGATYRTPSSRLFWAELSSGTWR